MTQQEMEAFVKSALHEDMGDGDHTSLACVPAKSKRKATLLCKEKGMLAGVSLATFIFQYLDPELILEEKLPDGSHVQYGDVAFTLEGKARAILLGERLALNCLQRMSGIATATHEMVEKLSKYPTKVLDTRKTTPGFRAMEKWAVKIGGGENHRFGLFDMIMIKDNHIDYAGGIDAAIKSVNAYLNKTGKNLKIEIEARNLEELEEILQIGKIDRIMLDNFSPEELKTALGMINRQYETEASGGITTETIEAYAACGVDYISVGALTHQARSLDMSLKAI